MPELTPKLGIKKPLGNETVNRTSFNENWDIIDANVVADKGGVPSIQAGLDASKPTAGTVGRLYIATDTYKIYRDNGTSWDVVGTVNWNDIQGKPTSFTPSAHKSTHASGGSDPITPADIGAVNKAGDTMTGLLTIQRPGATLVVVNTDYTGTEKRVFFGADANGRLFLRALTGQGVVIRNSGDATDLVTVDNTGLMKINGNTVWHAGNDGAGSGLDADTVDGLHASDLESVPEGATIYGKVGFWAPAEGGFEVISQFASPRTYPRGLTWDGTNLWNADSDAEKIYKLNTSGTILSQFASPSTVPTGLAWDGTNLWNADYKADQIYKLNTSGTILSQFESPSTAPTGLAWDGTYLWNADLDADKIYKLNTSGTIISQFASPSTYPRGLTWDGTNLWNADSETDKIYKLNTSGTILSQFASPSTHPTGLAWDGTYLWNADTAMEKHKIYKIAVYNYKLVA